MHKISALSETYKIRPWQSVFRSITLQSLVINEKQNDYYNQGKKK